MAGFYLRLAFLLIFSLGHVVATGIGSFSVGLTPNPNYTPNGPAAYARAIAKWGTSSENAEVASNKGNTGDIPAQTEAGDREYLSSVQIGTPPQQVLVDLDTGSSDFWVFSNETTGADLGSRQIWYPGNSSTANKIEAVWMIRYGDGSMAEGNVWTDTLEVGPITIPNATIESAVTVSDSMLEDPIMSGLFGLAFNLTSQVRPVQPTILQLMLPELENKLFSVDLNYHAAGDYLFGQINSSRYNGNIEYTPLIQGGQGFWQFNFTGFNFGDSGVWGISEWPAIADTGTSLLLLDNYIVDSYYEAVPTAVFDEDLSAYTFPCDTQLPDMRVGFVNGWHATIPGAYLNYSAYQGVCYGGLQYTVDEEFSILGDIFLKTVYAIFDVSGAQIGFADKNLTTP